MPNSVILLIAMTVVVAIVAVYRKIVSRNEDDFVHLAEGTSQLIVNQQKTAQSLQTLDRIGITLTVATAAYGVGLLAMYLYTGLMQSGKM